MNTTKVFIAGFGGQGVLLIGKMLTYGGMVEGKEVTWMPSYGPEMRGGTANCTVCIAEGKVASPVVSTCDILVVMNTPSLVKFESLLCPGGKLFINTSIIKEKPTRKDITVYDVDCLKVAEKEVGTLKVGNMVMLGAIIRASGVLKLDTMEKVFHKTMEGKKKEMIPLNMKALMAWENPYE